MRLFQKRGKTVFFDNTCFFLLRGLGRGVEAAERAPERRRSGWQSMGAYVAAGHKLLRCISAVRMTDTAASLFNNFTNLAAAKITSFQTSMNSVPIQTNIMNCADGDDYRYLSNYLQDSAVVCSNDYYSICPVFIDEFANCMKSIESKEKDSVESGISTAAELTYGINYMKVAAAHTCNLICVGLKTLSSGPLGVMLV